MQWFEDLRESPEKAAKIFKVAVIVSYCMLMLGSFLIIAYLLKVWSRNVLPPYRPGPVRFFRRISRRGRMGTIRDPAICKGSGGRSPAFS